MVVSVATAVPNQYKEDKFDENKFKFVNGIYQQIYKQGVEIQENQSVLVSYTLRLENDPEKILEQATAWMHKNYIIDGIYEAIKQTGYGGKGTFIIPPALGFDSKGSDIVPPNATILLDIEVIEVKDGDIFSLGTLEQVE